MADQFDSGRFDSYPQNCGGYSGGMSTHKQGHSFWRSFGPLIGGAALLCTICVGALLWLLGAFLGLDELCANEIVTTETSPNGALKVILFRRDCGATTTYSTHVSMIPASSQLPNEPGNIFVQSGTPIVVVRWIDDHHLSISGGGASTAFEHRTKHAGVQITYD